MRQIDQCIHRSKVLKKKQLMEIEEQKRKYFLLFKWVLLNRVKRDYLDKKTNHFKLMIHLANFIKRIKLRQMLTVIYNNFRHAQTTSRKKSS